VIKAVVVPAVLVTVAAVGGADLLQRISPPRTSGTAAGVPVSAPVAGSGKIVLEGDGRGHFTAQVTVDGASLPMLVDTGASSVALTFEDAERLGVVPPGDSFTAGVQTGNGIVRAAPVRLRSVELRGISGTIRQADVEALVMPRGRLGTSLLGMSFLRRLGRVEMAADRLVLER
jgi:aspartyl protease family protein